MLRALYSAFEIAKHYSPCSEPLPLFAGLALRCDRRYNTPFRNVIVGVPRQSNTLQFTSNL